MSRNRLIQVAAALAVVLLFVVFNSDSRPRKSPQQQRFEAWLKGLEMRVNREVTAGQPLPKVSVSATYPDRAAPVTLEIQDPVETKPKVLRVLELAREADLFSVARDTPPSSGEYVALKIEDETQSFRAYLTPKIARERVQLSTLLKLLQVLSTPTPVPAANQGVEG